MVVVPGDRQFNTENKNTDSSKVVRVKTEIHYCARELNTNKSPLCLIAICVPLDADALQDAGGFTHLSFQLHKQHKRIQQNFPRLLEKVCYANGLVSTYAHPVSRLVKYWKSTVCEKNIV